MYGCLKPSHLSALKLPKVRSEPSVSKATRVILVCGRRNNSSTNPSSSMIRRVVGCTVSPRKSRRKSLCFSKTTTWIPARASKQRVNKARRTATGNTDLGLQTLRHGPTLPAGSWRTGSLPSPQVSDRSAGSGHLAVSAQRLDLALEIVCRRKRPVDRGEAQIGHLVEFSQRAKDRKPDLVAGYFR